MKIYDLHVHTRPESDPKTMIGLMDEAGVYGAAVFSQAAAVGGRVGGAAYKERLEGVLEFCKPYPERLFPVMWAHPYEDGAVEKAQEAASKGVVGFKIICNSFYVYEDKSMELLKAIAGVNKPVCFHSGILWGGGINSKYNRPVNWEDLIDIPGLKFSMGHCSWPWYDECIALYGKFQNAYLTKPNASEMFFDLTPGTPVPYRRDLITKLHTVGYDVKHNILFGTDCNTNYRAKWAKDWMDIDNGLYNEIGVDEETRENIYKNNFLRFFGFIKENPAKIILTSDGAGRGDKIQ